VATYAANTPKREGFDAIGVDEQGGEHVLPLLVAGNGVDQRNPEPGTPGWREIVQAGVSSATSADPPNEQELAIWRRVAEEEMPLDFVSRNDATLTLRVPQWWVVAKVAADEPEDEPYPMDQTDGRTAENFGIQPTPAGHPDLEELLLGALEASPFTVTVSRYVQEPVHRGDQHIYPPEAWGEVVADAIELLVERLLPEEDGVVVGHVEDAGLVAQALALLAQGVR
jgi:hypothetical protein